MSRSMIENQKDQVVKCHFVLSAYNKTYPVLINLVERLSSPHTHRSTTDSTIRNCDVFTTCYQYSKENVWLRPDTIFKCKDEDEERLNGGVGLVN